MPVADLVPWWSWGLTNGRLHFGMQSMPKADPSPFKPLSDFWGSDEKRVYCAGQEVRGAELQTFQVLNRLFAKDAYSAYTITGPIKDADSELALRAWARLAQAAKAG